MEGNRYIVTIIGYHHEINGKEVLKSEEGFAALAKRLPNEDIYEEIKDATPLSDTAIYQVPFISWRRFEKMKNLPEDLLLIGDTICRIDPVFGQGMSIAVLEALALKKQLQQSPTPEQATATFHKEAAKIIAPIWNMVITKTFVTMRRPGNNQQASPSNNGLPKPFFCYQRKIKRSMILS